jgi:hypothetical protein
MKPNTRRVAILAAVLLSCGLVAQSNGAPIGDIQVVYNAPNPFGIGIQDGPAFVIENFSATPITNAFLSILVGGDNAIADTFNVGTIPANSFVVIEPGLSNDGGAGHTFFTFLGSILDTSDGGPSANGVPFSFNGLLGALTVSSSTFTPAATAGTTNDGTISNMNFLGGPGNNDGPCSDCFGPKVVADINILSTVPDHGSTFALLLIALIGCTLFHRYSTSRRFV